MTATAVALLGLVCHCAGDEDGHEPGRTGCGEAPVKSPAIRPFKAGPTPSQPGGSVCGVHGGLRSTTARGTCPTCGREDVKVAAPWRTWHHPDYNPGVRLGVELALAPHRRPGKGAPVCEHRGGPAETTFTPGGDLRVAIGMGREYIR